MNIRNISSLFSLYSHTSTNFIYKTTEDDDVFEEERAKGLNLPTEGHVREAVFTKAIESAINPLAYGIQIPNMGELQSGQCSS